MTLYAELQAEAERLGFSLLGVTHLQPPPHLPEFQRWLEGGFHGEMRYLQEPLALEKRAHPDRFSPGAKAVVCLALPYPHPPVKAEFKAGTGRVAAYAWGEDYHLTIPPRLSALAQRLESAAGRRIVFRGAADSAPILERDLAQRAGLGWIGKNTCLIHPRHGSFFFLAELFIDLDLAPDAPFNADRCGTCRRCIQACPTGCILPNRTIDARRCISYLTIENKGEIPLELRPHLGNWVFGCDVCQSVCPWNHPARSPQPNPALVYPGVAESNLAAELLLTPQGFNQKFAGSPILRAKRRGYLRNIAVAFGNQPDPAHLPALAEVLAHEVEPLVRAHAVWAVRQIHHPSADRLLASVRLAETDPTVLKELESLD